MATILTFPLARRRDLIARCAARMTQLPAGTAEKHLQHQLHVQAETMSRRGIRPDVINVNIRQLEGAIRVELWRQVLASGSTG